MNFQSYKKSLWAESWTYLQNILDSIPESKSGASNANSKTVKQIPSIDIYNIREFILFFCSWEIFHGKYGICVSIFQRLLPMFCLVLSSGKTTAVCFPQVREGPLIVSVFLHVVHRNLRIPGHRNNHIKGSKKIIFIVGLLGYVLYI